MDENEKIEIEWNDILNEMELEDEEKIEKEISSILDKVEDNHIGQSIEEEHKRKIELVSRKISTIFEKQKKLNISSEGEVTIDDISSNSASAKFKKQLVKTKSNALLTLMLQKKAASLKKEVELAEQKARSVTIQWTSDKNRFNSIISVKQNELEELTKKMDLMEKKVRMAEQLNRDRIMAKKALENEQNGIDVVDIEDVESEFEKLKKQVEDLESELSEKKKALAERYLELSDAKMELANSLNKIEILSRRVEELVKSEDILNDQVDVLEKENTETKRIQNKLENDLEEAKASVEKIEKECELIKRESQRKLIEFEEKENEMVEEQKKLEQSLEKLATEKEEMRKQMQNNINALNREKDFLRLEKEQVVNDNKHLLVALNQTVDSCKKIINEFNLQQDVSESKMNAHFSKTDKLAKDLESLGRLVSNIKAEAEGRQKEYEKKLQEQKEAHLLAQKAQEEKIEGLEKSLFDTRSALDREKKESEEKIKKAVEEETHKRESIEKALKHANEEVTSRDNEIKILNDTVSDLESKLKNGSEEADSLRKEFADKLTKLETENNELNARLKDRSSGNEYLTSDLASKIKEIERLKEDLNYSTNYIEILKQELRGVESESDEEEDSEEDYEGIESEHKVKDSDNRIKEDDEIETNASSTEVLEQKNKFKEEKRIKREMKIKIKEEKRKMREEIRKYISENTETIGDRKAKSLSNKERKGSNHSEPGIQKEVSKKLSRQPSSRGVVSISRGGSEKRTQKRKSKSKKLIQKSGSDGKVTEQGSSSTELDLENLGDESDHSVSYANEEEETENENQLEDEDETEFAIERNEDKKYLVTKSSFSNQTEVPNAAELLKIDREKVKEIVDLSIMTNNFYFSKEINDFSNKFPIEKGFKEDLIKSFVLIGQDVIEFLKRVKDFESSIEITDNDSIQKQLEDFLLKMGKELIIQFEKAKEETFNGLRENQNEMIQEKVQATIQEMKEESEYQVSVLNKEHTRIIKEKENQIEKFQAKILDLEEKLKNQVIGLDTQSSKTENLAELKTEEATIDKASNNFEKSENLDSPKDDTDEEHLNSAYDRVVKFLDSVESNMKADLKTFFEKELKKEQKYFKEMHDQIFHREDSNRLDDKVSHFSNLKKDIQGLQQELVSGSLMNIGDVRLENFDRLKSQNFGTDEIVSLTILEHHLRYDSSINGNLNEDQSAANQRQYKMQIQSLKIQRKMKLDSIVKNVNILDLFRFKHSTEQHLLLLSSLNSWKSLLYYKSGGMFRDVLQVHLEVLENCIKLSGGMKEAMNEIYKINDLNTPTNDWPDPIRVRCLEVFRYKLMNELKEKDTKISAIDGIGNGHVQRNTSFLIDSHNVLPFQKGLESKENQKRFEKLKNEALIKGSRYSMDASFARSNHAESPESSSISSKVNEKYDEIPIVSGEMESGKIDKPHNSLTNILSNLYPLELHDGVKSLESQSPMNQLENIPTDKVALSPPRKGSLSMLKLGPSGIIKQQSRKGVSFDSKEEEEVKDGDQLSFQDKDYIDQISLELTKQISMQPNLIKKHKSMELTSPKMHKRSTNTKSKSVKFHKVEALKENKYSNEQPVQDSRDTFHINNEINKIHSKADQLVYRCLLYDIDTINLVKNISTGIESFENGEKSAALNTLHECLKYSHSKGIQAESFIDLLLMGINQSILTNVLPQIRMKFERIVDFIAKDLEESLNIEEEEKSSKQSHNKDHDMYENLDKKQNFSPISFSANHFEESKAPNAVHNLSLQSPINGPPKKTFNSSTQTISAAPEKAIPSRRISVSENKEKNASVELLNFSKKTDSMLPDGFICAHFNESEFEILPNVRFASDHRLYDIMERNKKFFKSAEEIISAISLIHSLSIRYCTIDSIPINHSSLKVAPSYLDLPSVEGYEPVLFPSVFPISQGINLISGSMVYPLSKLYHKVYNFSQSEKRNFDSVALPEDVLIFQVADNILLPKGLIAVELSPIIKLSDGLAEKIETWKNNNLLESTVEADKENLFWPPGFELVQITGNKVLLPTGVYVAPGVKIVSSPFDLVLPENIRFVKKRKYSSLPDYMTPITSVHNEEENLMINIKMEDTCTIVKKPSNVEFGLGMEIIRRPNGFSLPAGMIHVPLSEYPEGLILEDDQELVQLIPRFDLPKTSRLSDQWKILERPEGVRLQPNQYIVYPDEDLDYVPPISTLPDFVTLIPIPNIPYNIYIPPHSKAIEFLPSALFSQHSFYGFALPEGVVLGPGLKVLNPDKLKPYFYSNEASKSSLKYQTIKHPINVLLVERESNKPLPNLLERGCKSDLPYGMLLGENMDIVKLKARFELPLGVKLDPGAQLGPMTQFAPGTMLGTNSMGFDSLGNGRNIELEVMEWPHGFQLESGYELVKKSTNIKFLPFNFEVVNMDSNVLPKSSMVIKLPRSFSLMSSLKLSEKITVGVESVFDGSIPAFPPGTIFASRLDTKTHWPPEMTPVPKSILPTKLSKLIDSINAKVEIFDSSKPTRRVKNKEETPKPNINIEVVKLMPNYSMPIGTEIYPGLFIAEKPFWLKLSSGNELVQFTQTTSKEEVEEVFEKLRKLGIYRVRSRPEYMDFGKKYNNSNVDRKNLKKIYNSLETPTILSRVDLPSDMYEIYISPSFQQVYCWGPYLEGVEAVKIPGDVINLPPRHFLIERPRNKQGEPLPPGFKLGLSDEFKKWNQKSLPPQVEIMHLQPTFQLPLGINIINSSVISKNKFNCASEKQFDINIIPQLSPGENIAAGVSILNLPGFNLPLNSCYEKDPYLQKDAHSFVFLSDPFGLNVPKDFSLHIDSDQIVESVFSGQSKFFNQFLTRFERGNQLDFKISDYIKLVQISKGFPSPRERHRQYINMMRNKSFFGNHYYKYLKIYYKSSIEEKIQLSKTISSSQDEFKKVIVHPRLIKISQNHYFNRDRVRDVTENLARLSVFRLEKFGTDLEWEKRSLPFNLLNSSLWKLEAQVEKLDFELKRLRGHCSELEETTKRLKKENEEYSQKVVAMDKQLQHESDLMAIINKLRQKLNEKIFELNSFSNQSSDSQERMQKQIDILTSQIAQFDELAPSNQSNTSSSGENSSQDNLRNEVQLETLNSYRQQYAQLSQSVMTILSDIGYSFNNFLRRIINGISFFEKSEKDILDKFPREFIDSFLNLPASKSKPGSSYNRKSDKREREKSPQVLSKKNSFSSTNKSPERDRDTLSVNDEEISVLSDEDTHTSNSEVKSLSSIIKSKRNDYGYLVNLSTSAYPNKEETSDLISLSSSLKLNPRKTVNKSHSIVDSFMSKSLSPLPYNKESDRHGEDKSVFSKPVVSLMKKKKKAPQKLDKLGPIDNSNSADLFSDPIFLDELKTLFDLNFLDKGQIKEDVSHFKDKIELKLSDYEKNTIESLQKLIAAPVEMVQHMSLHELNQRLLKEMENFSLMANFQVEEIVGDVAQLFNFYYEWEYDQCCKKLFHYYLEGKISSQLNRSLQRRVNLLESFLKESKLKSQDYGKMVNDGLREKIWLLESKIERLESVQVEPEINLLKSHLLSLTSVNELENELRFQYIFFKQKAAKQESLSQQLPKENESTILITESDLSKMQKAAKHLAQRYRLKAQELKEKISNLKNESDSIIKLILDHIDAYQRSVQNILPQNLLIKILNWGARHYEDLKGSKALFSKPIIPFNENYSYSSIQSDDMDSDYLDSSSIYTTSSISVANQSRKDPSISSSKIKSLSHLGNQLGSENSGTKKKLGAIGSLPIAPSKSHLNILNQIKYK